LAQAPAAGEEAGEPVQLGPPRAQPTPLPGGQRTRPAARVVLERDQQTLQGVLGMRRVAATAEL
jgi:hypothetical protein